MMKNTLEFAIRCTMENLGEDKLGNVSFRFDTRFLGGDHTIIKVMAPFATESVARAKLFEELMKWEGK